MNASFRAGLPRVCAIAGALATFAFAGCTPPPPPKPVPVAPPPVVTHLRTAARHPLVGEEPEFIRLSNIPRGHTPVRVGVLLPFSNGSATTRTLAKGLMNAAELALFDARNPDLLLMPGDEGASPRQAAAAARTLISEGAEIIIGPLFAPSVSAVAPVVRDHGIALIGLSTDRSVGGDGVYLLSYQPETEVQRVVSYSASRGHTNFTAVIPRTAYGDRVLAAFKAEAAKDHVTVRAVLRYDSGTPDLSQTASAASSSGADAILIAQGGQQLAAMAAQLGNPHPQLLGTGLWSEKSLLHESSLSGGWFAAPPAEADAAFQARYRSAYRSTPPQLATLAYDAVSLVAALSKGAPYHRFTDAALTDPDGFSGVSGIFRFMANGSCERGLAILRVEPDGFHIVDPAPQSFQAKAS